MKLASAPGLGLGMKSPSDEEDAAPAKAAIDDRTWQSPNILPCRCRREQQTPPSLVDLIRMASTEAKQLKTDEANKKHGSARKYCLGGKVEGGGEAGEWWRLETRKKKRASRAGGVNGGSKYLVGCSVAPCTPCFLLFFNARSRRVLWRSSRSEMWKEDEALPWLSFGLFFYLDVETFFRFLLATAAATAARHREREEEGGVSLLTRPGQWTAAARSLLTDSRGPRVEPARRAPRGRNGATRSTPALPCGPKCHALRKRGPVGRQRGQPRHIARPSKKQRGAARAYRGRVVQINAVIRGRITATRTGG
jgi:hypothetical protein